MVEIFEMQMCMQSALHQTAKEMAVEGYAYKLMGGSSITNSLPVQIAFSETYVRGKVNKLITKVKIIEDAIQITPISGEQFTPFLRILCKIDGLRLLNTCFIIIRKVFITYNNYFLKVV